MTMRVPDSKQRSIPSPVLLCAFVLTLWASPAPRAQQTTPKPSEETRSPEEPPQKLSWPRDKKRPVCRVADGDHTLEVLVDHIVRNHADNAAKMLDLTYGRELASPRGPTWVRQYADVIALERWALEEGKLRSAAEDTLKASRKAAFEGWLEAYGEERAARRQPLKLDQDEVDRLYLDFRRTNGLASEVQGWLDFLVPEIEPKSEDVQVFYDERPQYFGGVLTMAHILVETRDPRTLELKTGKAAEEAQAKIARIQKLLNDGELEFEEIARRESDDRRTAPEGGRLNGVKRFDPRLPATLSRAAWRLQKGDVSEPIQSPYGVHFVKRIGYRQVYFVIFTDKIRKEVAETARRSKQEDILIRAREKFGVELLY